MYIHTCTNTYINVDTDIHIYFYIYINAYIQTQIPVVDANSACCLAQNIHWHTLCTYAHVCIYTIFI